MQLSYKGKSAIVTGACGGMGLEISKNLSANNINVLIYKNYECQRTYKYT